jgi:hypothetical protein
MDIPYRVYYESIKQEPKIRGIKKCRCDERLQTKTKEFARLPYTGFPICSAQFRGFCSKVKQTNFARRSTPAAAATSSHKKVRLWEHTLHIHIYIGTCAQDGPDVCCCSPVNANEKKKRCGAAGGAAGAIWLSSVFCFIFVAADGELSFYMFWIAVEQMCCPTVINTCLMLLLSCFLCKYVRIMIGGCSSVNHSAALLQVIPSRFEVCILQTWFDVTLCVLQNWCVLQAGAFAQKTQGKRLQIVYDSMQTIRACWCKYVRRDDDRRIL